MNPYLSVDDLMQHRKYVGTENARENKGPELGMEDSRMHMVQYKHFFVKVVFLLGKQKDKKKINSWFFLFVQRENIPHTLLNMLLLPSLDTVIFSF